MSEKSIEGDIPTHTHREREKEKKKNQTKTEATRKKKEKNGCIALTRIKCRRREKRPV